MDFYIHYTALPQGKSLADVVGELNEVLEDGGAVCGGQTDGPSATAIPWSWSWRTRR